MSTEPRRYAPIEKYRQAVEADLGNTEALAGWGRALLAMGQFDAAVAKLDRAIKLKGNAYGAFMQRGRVYFHAGRREDAAHDFEAALRIDPENPSSLLWLAVARPDSRQDLKAKAAEIDLERWPGPILRLFLGELSPEELLAKAQEQACVAHFFIGEYYLQHNDNAAAADAFRRAIQTNARDLYECTSARLELRRLGLPDNASAVR